MKIAKIKGIEVQGHFSTIIIMFLIGFTAQDIYSNNYYETNLTILIIFGFLTAAITLLTIVIHELAHAVTAKSFGIEIKEIELNFIGGATTLSQNPKKPGEEAKMAGFGPLSSIIMGGIFLLLSLIPLPNFALALFTYVGATNLGLGLFNLLPAFPMDGGRILRAIIWKQNNDFYKATKAAARFGMKMGSVVMVLGFITLFLPSAYFGFDNLINIIWIMFMGNSIRNSSKKAHKATRIRESLSKISINTLIHEMEPMLDHNRYFSEIVTRFLKSYQQRSIIVTDGEKNLGIFHVDLIADLTDQMKQTGQLKDMFIPFDQIQHVKLEDSAEQVVDVLRNNKHEVDVVLVDDQNQNVVGFVDLYDIEFYVQVQHRVTALSAK